MSCKIEIKVEQINEDNIKELQTLNSTMLPVIYSESTYKQILQSGFEFSYLGNNNLNKK
jgi:hypothetical protein